MRFHLIDYSELFYKTIVKTAIPAKRIGKFVQIRDNNTEYLVLSPKDFSAYHAHIAERFFTQKGIAGTYNAKCDHFEVKEPDWHIVGGGIWAINEKQRSLHLSGNSQAYGKFDRRNLKEKIFSVKYISDFEIIID